MELDFKLLFEESPDVLLVLLPDSPRFTAVAATKARLVSTHSTAEETLGRGLFELFPDNPNDPNANATVNLRASLERVMATKAPDTMAVQKYDIPLPDGGFEIKYWSPRNIPILGEDGAVRYILHRAVDVTDLARASEEGDSLRGRTAEMEREVVRRSRELDAANRQMRAANEELSQLDVAKTAFFNNISHEFRTPLTLMLGPLEDGLADESAALPLAQRQRVQLAHDNALRLLQLVNSLLDFARLEAGRLRGNFAPLDLAGLTRNLTGMFQSAFDKANLGLAIDCPDSVEPIWGDREMWEKIVPNLVSNAFKFTWTGGVHVGLSQTATHVVLEVRDSGTGIPPADIDRVFERFHRVAGAAGRSHEGAGIGLALVRDLVELHGGTIGVVSERGVGTAFRVEIPRGFAHLPADAVAHRPPPAHPGFTHGVQALEASRWTGRSAASNAPAPSCRDAHDRPFVLVVDDNGDLRDYMSGLLRADYDVVTADDGLAALSLIRTRLPDIVVSDVMMPRMTGIELVQALRTDPETVAVPVILLSARAGEAATVDGLQAGSDDYLTKPFTAGELLGRVRAHLKLGQARRQLTASLEAANRELDSFSHSVAHDLRGPLRSIAGFSQILQQDHGERLDDTGRRCLDMVQDSAARMSRVIDDLLRLSQLSRSELRRIPFDLSSVAQTVAIYLNESEPGRRVACKIAPGVTVDGDPHLLQIVLDNLLRNAWKFTSKRADAEVEFGVACADDDVCYYVRDNGAGFDMNYSARLFGVFQRLHPESEFHGTGVGLATVKRIIGRHGGRVWAVGAVGRGATFYFTLAGAAASFAGAQSAAVA